MAESRYLDRKLCLSDCSPRREVEGEAIQRTAGTGSGLRYPSLLFCPEWKLLLSMNGDLPSHSAGRIPMHTALHPLCRVLGVDDDHDVADSLGAFLECLGVEVRIVYSGADALAAIPEFMPALVFLDIAMPIMNGLETASRIRQLPEGKNLDLVALTAWGDMATRNAAQEMGFDHYVVKPMQIDLVEALISSVCSRASTKELDS